MKKTQVIFDVTENKTIATAIGLKGSMDIVDITGTDIEKDFTRILKKIQELQAANEVMDFVDINTWKEV